MKDAPAPDAYDADITLEHERWTEIAATCQSLSPDERTRHGYFRDPDWTVKDMVGHFGAWMPSTWAARRGRHRMQGRRGVRAALRGRRS